MDTPFKLAKEILRKGASIQQWRQGLEAIDDDETRRIVETLLVQWAQQGAPDAHIVVLIHGIRTRAEWQSLVEQEFASFDDVDVRSLGYEFFDAFRFWCPLFTRKGPVKRIAQEIRILKTEHPNDHISVIAHSFGTYAVSKIVEDHPDIRFHRIILCGCIIDGRFRWDKVQGDGNVVNDCGTRDIWPVLAKATTWGYGASGRFGFKAAKVRDRFHDLDHSGFFKSEFIREFWIPFIRDGEVIASAHQIRPVSYWMSLLAFLPSRILCAALVVSLLSAAVLGLLHFGRAYLG